MRFNDYLLYLLNTGENPEDSAVTRQQHLLGRGGQEHCHDIALLLPADESTQLLPASFISSRDLAACDLSLKHHKFTQIDLDTPLQSRPFDELHWVCTEQTNLSSLEHLKTMAGLVHLHFVGKPRTGNIPPEVRVYNWQRWQDIVEFWISLYRARESLGSFGLNWGSYPSKSHQPMIAQYTFAYGRTPSTSLLHLKNRIRLTKLPRAREAVLVIEYSLALRVDEYARIIDLTGSLLKCDIAPVLDLSEEHNRCNLRLLTWSYLHSAS